MQLLAAQRRAFKRAPRRWARRAARQRAAAACVR